MLCWRVSLVVDLLTSVCWCMVSLGFVFVCVCGVLVVGCTDCGSRGV